MSDKKAKRTRNYACVVYPESAPSNWLEIISESKNSCFISPLHDKDINPTGEPKKPHYHILTMFNGVKSIEQATEFFKSFGGVGCEPVNNSRGYARYLCHLDNPEKAQYDKKDVKAFGGLDYKHVCGTYSDLKTEEREITKSIMQFIEENDVVSFAYLCRYCMNDNDDWFDYLRSHSYFIKEYIKSRAWEIHHQEEK